MREGIVLNIELINPVQEDEKDGDVDVRVGIKPNSFEKQFIVIGKLSGSASNLKLLKQGSKNWNDAIKAIKENMNPLKKRKSQNSFHVLVETKTNADAFLEAIFPDKREQRPNGERIPSINRWKNYQHDKMKDPYEKGYELHQQKIEGLTSNRQANHDLYHIKWYNGSASGHIFFQNF